MKSALPAGAEGSVGDPDEIKRRDSSADTIKQMGGVIAGMVGKRLMYRDLIANNGLASGARCE